MHRGAVKEPRVMCCRRERASLTKQARARRSRLSTKLRQTVDSASTHTRTRATLRLRRKRARNVEAGPQVCAGAAMRAALVLRTGCNSPGPPSQSVAVIWPRMPACLTMLSSESSPNRRARSQSDCVMDSTGIASLYVKRCCCADSANKYTRVSKHCSGSLRVSQHALERRVPADLKDRTCVSALACSINVFASAVSPLIAQPRCVSISMIFWMLLGSCITRGTPGISSCHNPRCKGGPLQPFLLQSRTSSGDVMRFSTARTTPWGVVTPMAVDPSCAHTREPASVSPAFPSSLQLP